MERSLSELGCEVCFQNFDSIDRKPTLFPCGHTFCFHCVSAIFKKSASSSYHCPRCREETTFPPEKLQQNFFVSSLLDSFLSINETTNKTWVPRFWCIECLKVANSVCEEEHQIRSLRMERSRQMKESADLLEQAKHLKSSVVDWLKPAAPSVQYFITHQVEELSRASEDIQTALSRLYENLQSTESEWESAINAAKELEASATESLLVDKDTLDLLQHAKRCDITVYDGSDCWSGHIGLPRSGASMSILAMLAAMQRVGLLNRTKPSSESTTTTTTTARSAQNDTVQGQKDEALGDTITTQLALCEPAGLLDVSHLRGSPLENRHQKDDLLSGRQQVSSLIGLYCQNDPGWACALLNVLGPQLRNLTLIQPNQDHLNIVIAMPLLKTLHVTITIGPEERFHHVGRRREIGLERLELDIPLVYAVPIINQFGTAHTLTVTSNVEDDCTEFIVSMTHLLKQHRKRFKSLPELSSSQLCDSSTKIWPNTIVLIRSEKATSPDHDTKCQSQFGILAAGLPAGIKISCNSCGLNRMSRAKSN